MGVALCCSGFGSWLAERRSTTAPKPNYGTVDVVTEERGSGAVFAHRGAGRKLCQRGIVRATTARAGVVCAPHGVERNAAKDDRLGVLPRNRRLDGGRAAITPRRAMFFVANAH